MKNTSGNKLCSTFYLQLNIKYRPIVTSIAHASMKSWRTRAPERINLTKEKEFATAYQILRNRAELSWLLITNLLTIFSKFISSTACWNMKRKCWVGYWKSTLRTCSHDDLNIWLKSYNNDQWLLISASTLAMNEKLKYSYPMHIEYYWLPNVYGFWWRYIYKMNNSIGDY